MNKKNEGGSVVLFAIFMVLFAVLAVIMLVGNAGYLFGSAKDLDEMIETEGEPVKGEFVTLDVDLVFDWYAEMEYKINGIIPAGTERYCLVYMEDIDAFISLTVKGKDNYKIIDDIISDSERYMNDVYAELPEAVTFEGKLTAIDPEVKEYYDDLQYDFNLYYSAYGWTPEFYELTIDTTETKGSIWLIIGICAALAVFFGLAMGATIKKKKEEKLQAATVASAMVGEGNDLVFGNIHSSMEEEKKSDSTEI